MNFLLHEGHSASRVNTTGVYDETTRSWRRSGGRKGFFDIVACLKPTGLYLTIDTKTGTDTPSQEQKDYRKEVIEAGGEAWFVSDLKKFIEYYTFIKENEFKGLSDRRKGRDM